MLLLLLLILLHLCIESFVFFLFSLSLSRHRSLSLYSFYLSHSMRPNSADLCLCVTTIVWSLLILPSNVLIPSLLQLININSSPYLCSAFNLEVRLPIIKKSVRGSYFGYSVAQHVIQEANRLNESV